MARRSPLLLLTIATGLGLLLAPLVSVEAASAVPPQDITISPSTAQLSAPPGGTTSGSLSVINGGGASFSFKTYADPYHVVGVDYDPSFTLIPGKTDPSSWVHFTTPTTATAAPNQTINLGYNLVVPSGTAPGGYYAVIFAETQPAVDAGGVTSHSRVGTILYITVQGPVTQAGSIRAVHQNHFVFASTVPLATEVENNGGLHFITTAKLTLANYLTNKPAFSASLQRYVLPQTVRKITAVTTPTPIIGLYKYEAQATFLGKTQTLPSQWVLVVHPVALWVIPIIVILIVIYLSLPKGRTKSKPKQR
jgi:hypothetical protein